MTRHPISLALLLTSCTMVHQTVALFFCIACTSPAPSHIDMGHDLLSVDSLPVHVVDGGLDGAETVALDGASMDSRSSSPDLSCQAFSTGITWTETSCEPGQEQVTNSGSCFHKICGCKNLMTCTDCYWSTWLPCNQ